MAAAAVLFLVGIAGCLDAGEKTTPSPADTVQLPPAETSGTVAIEKTIFTRRSVRSFSSQPLSLTHISQLLWAAAGKTIDGLTGATRSYPSAGGIYPLEIYLAAGNITGLDPGVYRYRWKTHRLERIESGDLRKELSRAAYGQGCLVSAPATIAIIAQVSKTKSRYGSRGEERYVAMDTGHSGQNIALQARALGLETVMVGAFNDEAVKTALGVKEGIPYYLIPVGARGP